MRNMLMILMLALLATPVAAAQEKNETTTEDPARPNDAAWVDDCPPDMMCAYGGAEDPSKAPDDGGCTDEGCVYKGEPGQAYGPEGCIECSGPIDDGSTCMDGEQANETCDDVQYLGGPTRGPADGSCEYCRGEPEPADPISAPADNSGGEVGVTSDDAKANSVPAAGFGIALAAIAIGAVLVIRKL